MRSCLAPIICHHCGMDYSHAYWSASATLEHPQPLVHGDAYLCFSCRRDTNRDAADAPRWVPSTALVVASHLAPTVTETEKQCRTCGGKWVGFIFGPAPSKGSPLPFGICDACADADEARFKELSKRREPEPPPVELARPRRAFGYDD